jgi:hypothetical protein
VATAATRLALSIPSRARSFAWSTTRSRVSPSISFSFFVSEDHGGDDRAEREGREARYERRIAKQIARLLPRLHRSPPRRLREVSSRPNACFVARLVQHDGGNTSSIVQRSSFRPVTYAS